MSLSHVESTSSNKAYAAFNLMKCDHNKYELRLFGDSSKGMEWPKYLGLVKALLKARQKLLKTLSFVI